MCQVYDVVNGKEFVNCVDAPPHQGAREKVQYTTCAQAQKQSIYQNQCETLACGGPMGSKPMGSKLSKATCRGKLAVCRPGNPKALSAGCGCSPGEPLITAMSYKPVPVALNKPQEQEQEQDTQTYLGEARSGSAVGRMVGQMHSLLLHATAALKRHAAAKTEGRNTRKQGLGETWGDKFDASGKTITRRRRIKYDGGANLAKQTAVDRAKCAGANFLKKKMSEIGAWIERKLLQDVPDCYLPPQTALRVPMNILRYQRYANGTTIPGDCVQQLKNTVREVLRVFITESSREMAKGKFFRVASKDIIPHIAALAQLEPRVTCDTLLSICRPWNIVASIKYPGQILPDSYGLAALLNQEGAGDKGFRVWGVRAPEKWYIELTKRYACKKYIQALLTAANQLCHFATDDLKESNKTQCDDGQVAHRQYANGTGKQPFPKKFFLSQELHHCSAYLCSASFLEFLVAMLEVSGIHCRVLVHKGHRP